MSEQNSFANIQRRNSAVMAKYEWTSTLMGMKHSGNEVHDRRTKTHRKANEFLQELLQKRSDGSLLDDNGTLDRYHKFLKYKTNLNDDDILNEFDRRLRALNKDRRNQTSKNNKESITVGLQTRQETDNNIQQLNNTDRSKSLSKSTMTSNNSLLSSISFEENQTNILSNTDEYPTSSLEQSFASSSSHSIKKTLHKPNVRRADGTEIIVTATVKPLRRASSNLLIFNHCYFPRSLKSHEQIHTSATSEKPVSSSSSSPIEQYDNNQLFHLLDQIENDCSSIDFTTMLNQLTLSSVETHQTDNQISFRSDHEDEEQENTFIIPNLFEQSSLSRDYYTTFTVDIDDPRKMSVYTMTIGIVQLSPSLTFPYSILNGRRPLLQCSIRTSFEQIHSKRSKHTYQVTAIESLTNIESLKENDIILKINDQSVWRLTTDAVQDILQQSKTCILTIARLCQPLI